MIVNDQKMVDFTYCLECKHWSTPEEEEPCSECLAEPVNTHSRKPIHFERNPKAKTDKRNGFKTGGKSR